MVDSKIDGMDDGEHVVYKGVVRHVVSEGMCKGQLDLSGLGITDLRDVEGLDKLATVTDLWIDHNELESTAGLEKCITLKQIHASHNKIRRIEGLSGLPELFDMDIDHNELASLDGLPMERMLSVGASYNRIESVAFSPGSFSGGGVGLSHNAITSVSVRDWNGNAENSDFLGEWACPVYLEYLDLSYNKLESLDWMEHIYVRKQLKLQFNLIENVDALKKVKLPDIPELWGNPLSNSANRILDELEAAFLEKKRSLEQGT